MQTGQATRELNSIRILIYTIQILVSLFEIFKPNANTYKRCKKPRIDEQQWEKIGQVGHKFLLK